jgi:SAM-dependent methyltransferase
MLAGFHDLEGRSSYEVIAEETNGLPRDVRLLDLACGDGYLLDLLAQRGMSNMAGVDRSPEELAAARERRGPRAELYCQDARALSLPARSVEVVLCHVALMLMDSVESVLAEIVRVLRPGGRLVAIVNRYLLDAAFEVYRRELHHATAQAGMARLRLGDPRMFTVEGLRELICGPGFDNEDLTIQDFDVQTRATPVALWSMLRLSYDAVRLPPSAQAMLEERLLRGWEPLKDESGLVSCSMGMRLLKCRTPTSPR